MSRASTGRPSRLVAWAPAWAPAWATAWGLGLVLTGCLSVDGEVPECFAAEDTCGAGLVCISGACVVDPAAPDQAVDAEAHDEGPACTPTDEICNGADDDCDGTADEDQGVGEPCRAGDGLCARAGRMACDPEGAGGTICVPGNEPPTGEPERCDNADNDCDGFTDEGFGVGEPCTSGLGLCLREGVRICTPEGEARCDAEAGPPGEERCNTLDDDCDGDIDEGYEALGAPCAEGIGGCATMGVLMCSGDGSNLICSTQAGDPRPEACGDDVDNDCDGRTDEGFGDLGDPCEVGTGACEREGVFICDPLEATRMRCSVSPGQPNETDARCDAIDEDCDGVVDEQYDADPVDCGDGACAAQGQLICVNGEERNTCRAGMPAEDDTTCDGQDDDCDGRADEDAPLRQVSCGVGLCQRGGVELCVGGRLQVSCQPGVPGPVDDQCNGLDEDCDGEADEGFLQTPVDCGIGACAARGLTRCANGQIVDNCTPGEPADVDLCDGVDADCDGLIDEGATPQEVRCGTGACARDGQRLCVDGVLQELCQPAAPAPDDLRCDGVDEDCDGRVDEGFNQMPVECGVGACRADGVNQCREGQPSTLCMVGIPADNDATCDAIDDDCDGLTDEDVQPRAVNCGDGACSAQGQVICVNGEEQNTCREGEPAPNDDTCDGRDDDCDGRTDEDTTPQPIECGQGACVAMGEAICQGGQVQNQCVPGDPAPADATCDSIDDDCDGQLDEDFGRDPISCGVGSCARPGLTRCMGGDVIDDCTPGMPEVERCNTLLDEDCDGRVDEGFEEVGGLCFIGVGACRSSGRIICSEDLIDTTCGAVPLDPRAERCNGVDDDCDGTVDEEAGEVGDPCDSGQLGICANGRFACQEERLVCVAQAQPGVEICNDQLDDDCDGRADEMPCALP